MIQIPSEALATSAYDCTYFSAPTTAGRVTRGASRRLHLDISMFCSAGRFRRPWRRPSHPQAKRPLAGRGAALPNPPAKRPSRPHANPHAPDTRTRLSYSRMWPLLAKAGGGSSRAAQARRVMPPPHCRHALLRSAVGAASPTRAARGGVAPRAATRARDSVHFIII